MWSVTNLQEGSCNKKFVVTTRARSRPTQITHSNGMLMQIKNCFTQTSTGFPPPGGGGGGPDLSLLSTKGKENGKYIVYLAVVSVKIDHF